MENDNLIDNGIYSELSDDEKNKEMMLSKQNRYVENYMTVEFVAIPPDFDIMNFLSLREQSGIFNFKNINLKQLKIISEGVKASPVFSILNNVRIDPITCLYFLKVINELGLVLKSIYNPIRKNIDYILNQLDDQDKHQTINIKRQNVKRVNFTIINLFPLMNEDVIGESLEIAKNLQKYQQEVDEQLELIKPL